MVPRSFHVTARADNLKDITHLMEDSMPPLQNFGDLSSDAIAWRRELHAHPELMFDLPFTSGFVAEKLRSFGCDEVVTGIAKSGVVAVIRGRRIESGKVVGLRADMDALPIEESGMQSYRSRNVGQMHACGHDGHTAMLLAAAKQLAAMRDFDGTVVLVFQPAEEGGGGGRVMLEEGLLERFGIQEIYAMHNMPNMTIGHFATRGGPMLAAEDDFVVTITGKGGHAAYPHYTVDPILVGAHLTMALQTIVARNVDPLQSAVLSVTTIKGGNALNVIEETAEIGGTIRTLEPEVRSLMADRFRNVVESVAQLHRAQAEIAWYPGYPVTTNDYDKADFARRVAEEITSPAAVDNTIAPVMGAEDFSYMLQRCPGALIWIGNGSSAELHHPSYDFNDAALPHGIAFWVRLTQALMPAA
jgi:hippurate hydrolase